jgi:S-disulfanyl-L-cysteine oxidoreductase SoxD
VTSRRSWATILSSAALVVSQTALSASGGAPTQGGGLSVWDGVYTSAQADRGRAVYASHCSRCHGEAAAASRENPLSGERFADHWEARTLADLFRRIVAMPPGPSAAEVDTADKRDALAYVLRQNGFPEGSAELPADDEGLAAIRITGKNGPAPMKTGALVKVAGCLRARAGREWALTDAAEPERTSLPAPPIDREPAASTPGTRTVALLNVFPSPAAHAGHTMRAVGFLVRNANGDSVNVVSLDLVAPGCAPTSSPRK